MKISLASTDNAKVRPTVRGGVPWIAGVLAVLVAGSALPQGNIDAGKSPAQMFADTCSNCHRRASELKRGASASFLRQHYTPGSQEAAAMASYLAGVAADPRAGKEREKATKAPQEKEKAKQQQAQERPQERPTERPQDRPKAAQQAQQQAPKGKRPELAKSELQPEAPAETGIEAVTVPPLEPFEE